VRWFATWVTPALSFAQCWAFFLPSENCEQGPRRLGTLVRPLPLLSPHTENLRSPSMTASTRRLGKFASLDGPT
jgi:hypothetical protein